MTDEENPTTYEFETESGTNVTVTARAGTLYVDANGPDIDFERAYAKLDIKRNTTVLDCGHQRTKGGELVNACIPCPAQKSHINRIKKNSERTHALEELEEASRTGEEVVVRRWAVDCNDDEKECSLDKMAEIATPDGTLKTRRTHTY